MKKQWRLTVVIPSLHVHACNENFITEFAKFLQLKSKLQEKKKQFLLLV